jgi:hypothetical protein
MYRKKFAVWYPDLTLQDHSVWEDICTVQTNFGSWCCVDSYFDLVKRQLPLQTMLLLRLIVINLLLVLPHRKSKAIIIAYRKLFVKNVKPHIMATSQRKKNKLSWSWLLLSPDFLPIGIMKKRWIPQHWPRRSTRKSIQNKRCVSSPFFMPDLLYLNRTILINYLKFC